MKNLLFLWFMGASIGTIAQSYSKADSIKIYALLDSADQIETMEQAMQYAQQALSLSKKSKMTRGEGFAHLKIAYLLVEHTENAHVNDHWEAAIHIGNQLKDNFMLALADIQQGKYMMYNENYDASETFFQKSLTIFFEREQSKYTAVLYNDLGYLCGKREQRVQEANWYIKAMKLHEKLRDLHGWANSAGNLANTFYRLGNKEGAIRYAKEAIQVHKKNNNIAGLATVCGNLSTMYMAYSELDSAVVYQQTAMKYTQINGQKKHLIQGYFNLSMLLDKQKKYPDALTAIEQSIALSQETNDLSGVATKSRIAAVLAAKVGNTMLMNKYYKDAAQLAESLGKKEVIRDIYASKSNYFEKENDFKSAYENIVKFHTLKDSLVNVQVKNNISALQIKYESEKKDFEISRLNTEQRIRNLEIEKQKAVIAGNKLEAQKKENEIKLLSQQQKLREAIFLQQKDLFEKQILQTKNKAQELMLTQQQLQLSKQDKDLKDRQLQRQVLIRNISIGSLLALALLAWAFFNRYQLRKKLEEQKALLAIRNNISKDLHDEIGSSITNINILNELTKRSLANTEEAVSYLNQSGENIQQISESLGDIVWNINPQYDDLDKLFVRMKRYAADMLEGANIKYNLQFPSETDNLKLAMDKRRDFYLLYKEAINNLVKYAKAENVHIRLQLQGNTLQLLIQDDGIGFDSQSVVKGNGLNNMQHRANLLKAHLEIQSFPNKGTSVQLDLTL